MMILLELLYLDVNSVFFGYKLLSSVSSIFFFWIFLVEDLQFEAPLKIVEYPDPKLRVRNKRIETFDDNLKKLVDEMFKVMYK